MRRGIGFQLAENSGPFQFFAGAGVRRIDTFSPCIRVFFVDQLGYGNTGEIRVSHEVGAVHECPAKSFDYKVNRLRRSILHSGQVVTLQNVQRLDQNRPPGRGGRRTDHFETAIRAANGLALLHFVVRQIVGGDEATALLHRGSDFAG